MKYGQKECYDCLGIFPSNLMRRFRFEEISGSSERMFDPNRKGDYTNPARTRVHTRVREVFLCSFCYPKRMKKRLFKNVLFFSFVALVGVILYAAATKSSSRRSATVANSSEAVTNSDKRSEVIDQVSGSNDTIQKSSQPTVSTQSTSNPAEQPPTDIPSSNLAYSRFFDVPNDTIADASCTVSVHGNPIIRGRCTVNTKDDRAIVFSNVDGCTIDLNGSGPNATAELSSYKNPCPLLYVDEAEPIYQLPLGNVTRRGDCWTNDDATICARR
ncbi:hypothetical protein [Sphingopyxis sp. NFH-91]|uniref:hypothetical protein n=1 Tax=Sphingopyxis sp. NFH-91 TaxID=2744457 RepID=UPI001F2FCB88|nr:hypothetical protein [Sphingopyxis sp. NFH-91]